jgi:protein SCO1/2
MNAKRFSIAAVAFLFAVAVAFWIRPSGTANPGVALRSAAPRAGALPLMTPTPQFSFPDQDDAAVTTQSLRGKVWIADFIFTQCGNTCPKMTARRVELQKQITDPRVMFLSFSVDPAHDDRATRKTYAAKNGVNEARWRFVCPPDRDSALKIAQSMKIAAVGHAQDAPILHSDRFVLIDADARVRGTYAMEDEQAMQRLTADALALASAPAARTTP